MDEFPKVKIICTERDTTYEVLFYDESDKSAYDFADEYIENNKGKMVMKVYWNNNSRIMWKYFVTWATIEYYAKGV
jgi:hypothetical protein